MEGSTGDIEFYIAIGLTEGSIVAGITTIRIAGIILVGSTSTGKDTVFTIEFSAVDGKRYDGSITFDSIYITTRFTWSSKFCRPQSRTHISATSGIDAINRFCFRTENAILDDNLGVGFERIYIGINIICVIAVVVNQIVLGIFVRTIKHHFFLGTPIGDAFIWCMGFVCIFTITDTIHTACSSTKDAAEDFAVVAFRKNLKGSAVDGDGAVAIEWVVDFYISCIMATSQTTAIKFGNNHAVVNVCIIVIFRMLWVEGDVGSTHECIQWYIVGLTSVTQCKLALSTQGSVYDTCHLATPHDDIHISIHCTLVVSG